jgi:hypothetical protein
MILTRENRLVEIKICPIATFSTTNHMWTALGMALKISVMFCNTLRSKITHEMFSVPHVIIQDFYIGEHEMSSTLRRWCWLVFNSRLVWLIAQKDFVAFSHLQSLRSYMVIVNFDVIDQLLIIY